MQSDRDELIAELFHLAAELPEFERESFLSVRCAGDPATRAEVEALLVADSRGQNESFLTPPVLRPNRKKTSRLVGQLDSHDTGAFGGSGLDEETFAPSTRIGRYTVLRVIASGGMGTVYEATQEHPRRTIALKVIRAGQASRSMLRRFEYEAQILGSLQHPGIAQVYEAGTHTGGHGGETGLAFIAMEFIAGARGLVEYANESGLSMRQRVDLMARVCDAVQYAHQRGVVHRDIKPGNVLVDACGQPRIIDFGVARMTDSDITAATQQTSAGQLIGTLRYMSPEQCEGDSRHIDTRSDVYALGVVLYELLAGRLPYDLSANSVASVPRIICEVAPLRPSVFVDALRGDVETIVLKTLEKEPQRRYQSAGDLAADLRHWLADQPIDARPPSTVYQLRKFARRNRPLVAGLGAAGLALAAGAGGTVWQAIRATHQRDIAQDAKIASDRDKATALSEAETSRRITEFFQNLLVSADPQVAQGKQITVHELVDRAAADIGDSLKDRPLVEAGVRAALGKTYVGLGDYPKAEAHFVEAIRLWEKSLGAGAPATLEMLNNLAAIHWMQGKLDLALREAREVLRGTQHHFGSSSLESFVAMDGLATILMAHGDADEAIELNGMALDGFRRILGDDDVQTVKCQNNLAFKLDSTGRSAEAEPMFRTVVAATRKLLGNDHPDTVTPIVNLGNCLRVVGKLDEAEALIRESLETRRRIYPRGHALTGDCCDHLGRILTKRGDAAGAVHYLTEGLEIHRASLPEGSWRIGVSAAWLGVAFTKLQRYAEAEALLLEGHATLQRTKGQHASQEAGVIGALADLYDAWGKPERSSEFRALLDHP